MRYRFIGLGYDIPITNMIDASGEDTNDPEQARAIVGPLADGKWLACQCEFCEIVTDVFKH